MLILFKNIFRIIFSFDEGALRDYYKNLGLACILGSLSGFFVKSHSSNHQLISLGILFTIGTVTSYLGVKRINKND